MRSPTSLPKPKRPKLFIVRRVHGESMLPALPPGKLILAVRPRNIARGDVVVIRHNGLEKIKRVVDVTGRSVYVQGDNTLASTDSRDFGWLDREAVTATVVWPRAL